jgi:hypothetical protein
LIPVREVIHSSEVSSVLDKSSLVTIFGGKYEPVPIILANKPLPRTSLPK